MQNSDLWTDSLGRTSVSAFAVSDVSESGCVDVSASNVLRYSDFFATSKQEFSKSIAQSSSIDVKYFTATVEASQSYVSITKTESDMKVFQVDTMSPNKYVSLQGQCARDLGLNSKMMADWDALPGETVHRRRVVGVGMFTATPTPTDLMM